MKKRKELRFKGRIEGDWLIGFNLSFNGLIIPIRTDPYSHPFYPQDEVEIIIKKVKKKGGNEK